MAEGIKHIQRYLDFASRAGFLHTPARNLSHKAATFKAQNWPDLVRELILAVGKL